MADSILRLRVESQEYDQKIKRAAEGIQRYADECRKAGGTLEYLDDGVLEFVQALGQMETVSTGTRQKMREMSNALSTLTETYRGLTDEEKASPFGQELANGIQQLTERAGQAKDTMLDVEQSIKNAASDTRAFDQIAQGMSVATAGFQGLTGAGKLLGIEMDNDVEVIAKLQAAMAVTNSLTTIQTALQKQSALMQGVQAAQAALAAAAQTTLATATGSATIAQAAFNAVAKANPYVLLATAIAAVGGALYAFTSASSEAKKEEEELAKAEEDATKKAQAQRDAFVNASATAMNTASRISNLQVAYKKANTEIEKTSILKEAQSEFKKLGLECKGLYDAQNLLLKEGGKIIEMIQLQGNAAALSAIRMEKFKESFKMLMENGYSAGAAASLATYNQDVQEIDNQINKIQGRIQGIRGTLPSSGGSSSGRDGSSGSNTEKAINADSIAAQRKYVQELTTEWENASGKVRDDIKAMLDFAQEKLTQMTSNWESFLRPQDIKKGDVGPLVSNQNFISDSNSTGGLKLTLDDNAMKAVMEGVQKSLPKEKDLLGDSKKLVGGLSQVAGGLQQMGVELPDGVQKVMGVIQGVMTVIEGVNAIISMTQTPAIVANTVALGALTSAMAVNTTSNFIPFFAHGGVVHAANGFSGVVPGNHFSGDNVPALLDAGEVVLNRAQAGVLANQLEGGGMGNLHVTGRLRGEDLIISIDRAGRRMGMGELAFFKNG